MSLGILYTLAGIFGFSFANVVQKVISLRYNVAEGLIFQYVFVTLFGFLWLFFFGSFSFVPSVANLSLLALAGSFGYLGVFGLYQGFRYLSSGIVLSVAFSFTFLGYFLNTYLFPYEETFSLGKMVLALVFFIIIGFLVLEKDIGGKMRFNRYVLYPILTAVSWTVYFGVTNYMVKKAILAPVQTVFYCELAILIICAIVLSVSIFTKKISTQSLHLDRKHLFLYILLGFGGFLGSVFMFYGYGNLPGNVVNFMSLFQVVLTSLGTYLVLGEKLDRNEWIGIVLAIVLLSLFIFI